MQTVIMERVELRDGGWAWLPRRVEVSAAVMVAAPPPPPPPPTRVRRPRMLGTGTGRRHVEQAAPERTRCDVEGHAWVPSQWDPAYVFCARCPAMAIWDDRTRVYELRRAA